MGWLLAFIFAGLAAVLGLFLFVQWEDRRRTASELQAASEWLQVLEKESFDNTKGGTESIKLGFDYVVCCEKAREGEL